MRNGVKDAFEMIGISKSLDKIIKLRKKYDNKELLLKIDSKTSLEFSKHFTTCYININNNRVIKYSYGSIRRSVSAERETFPILKETPPSIPTSAILRHSSLSGKS